MMLINTVGDENVDTGMLRNILMMKMQLLKMLMMQMLDKKY